MLEKLLLNVAKRTSVKHHTRTKYQWIKPDGHETDIKVYNFNTRGLVPLVLKHKNHVSWYTCGPTVYDSPHIGHGCCYVKIDIIHRVLRHYFKLNVVSIMNITDVDDKIIKKATTSSKTATEIARKYEEQFFHDMTTLGVEKHNYIARVSDFIPEISKFIQRLISTNKAYVSQDGSVYFRVAACKNYEKFEKLTQDALTGTKDNIKEMRADFALWKSYQPNEPYWIPEWGGKGRPAWHIECSAIAGTILGDSLDFHSGGVDIRFPHHQNEEAQSCEFFHKRQWVNNWLHVGPLKLDVLTNDKMSKSLGNTVSVQELLGEWSAAEFRMACCLSHYRHEMTYSKGLMSLARAKLVKFSRFLHYCESLVAEKQQISDEVYIDLVTHLDHAIRAIDTCFKTDFDIPGVIDALMSLVNKSEANFNVAIVSAPRDDQYKCNSVIILAIRNFVADNLQLLGVRNARDSGYERMRMNDIVELLVTFRNDIRQIAAHTGNRDLFRSCDEVRKKLRQKHIEVSDNNSASTWIDLKV